MRLVAVAILLTILNQAHGQSNTIFNYNVGTEFHREQHNRRGKLEFRTVEKIMRCDTTSEGLVYVTNFVRYSPDGKELFNINDSLKIVNGVLMINMKSIYHMKDNAMYKWRTESEYLSIPGTMTEGQTLPDAKVVCTVIKEPRVKVGVGAVPGSDRGARVIYAIKNRRVTRDTITTPMGEFQAYKVTADVVNESEVGYGYKVQFVTREWYADGFGLVGSEVWNDRGKLLSSTVMTKRTP